MSYTLVDHYINIVDSYKESDADPLSTAAHFAVLIGYARRAQDDGTGSFPGTDWLIKLARLNPKSGDRRIRQIRADLIAEGYLREGDQTHPGLLKHPADRRPICYDVATSEEQRAQWRGQRAAASPGRRDEFAEAGRKGAAVANGRKRISARAAHETHDEPPGNAERAETDFSPGRKSSSAEAIHLSDPVFTADADPQPHAADAGAPFGAPANVREEVANPKHPTWSRLLAEEDEELIEEAIDDEVDGLEDYEYSTVIGMRYSEMHPRAIINTILANRGTPTGKVDKAAVVKRLSKALTNEFLANGYEPTDRGHIHLEGILWSKVEERKSEEWLRDRWIPSAVKATVRQIVAGAKGWEHHLVSIPWNRGDGVMPRWP